MREKVVSRSYLLAAILFTAVMLFPSGARAQDARLTDDAYVSTANPSANFGGTGAMLIRGNASFLRGFIKFDLSTLPRGTTGNDVAKAVLTLYVSSMGSAGSFNVQIVSASWNELTITNSNAPSLGAAVATAVPVAIVNSFIS